MAKAPADIEALREACRTTSSAYEMTFAALRTGEADTAGHGNYALATGAAVGRPFEAGEMCWMDAGFSVEGFWSDFSRAAVLGPASADQREAQRRISEITAAGVAMVRPGVPEAEIAAAVNERVHGVGLRVTSWTSDLAGRIGHGIGYDITDPPHVSETDPTVLEPGMVVSIEPGVATDFGLFHIGRT